MGELKWEQEREGESILLVSHWRRERRVFLRSATIPANGFPLQHFRLMNETKSKNAAQEWFDSPPLGSGWKINMKEVGALVRCPD